MPYVEFPSDPVVNVHWHKKKDNGGGPGDRHLTCGAFTEDLFYKNPENAGIAGFAYWILYAGFPPIPISGHRFIFSGSLYGGARSVFQGAPTTPGAFGAYWPVYEGYLWSSPASWTVTYEDLYDLRYYIGLWRGISLNALMEFGFISTIPPNEIGPVSRRGASIEVTPQETDNGLPVIFGLYQLGTIITPDDPDSLLVTHSVPSIVQAHCGEAETTIGKPPPPAYFGNTPPTPPYDNYILSTPYPVP